jgi:aspartate aminotransferase
LTETDIYIISDEIYEKIIYGVPHYSIAQMGEALKVRTILVNGVSKSYAMTGWRIGYAAGPKEVISLMARLQSQETSNPASISQMAALEALNGPQEGVERMRKAFEERRDAIVGRLNAIPGITCARPDGAFYVFPNTSALYGSRHKDRKVQNSLDLCNFLLGEMKVSCVPGSGFGMDGHIRLSYATSMENIRKALDRIEEGVGKLSR